MRRLIHVPIMHEQADLGSLGAVLAARGTTMVGAERWARHETMLATFWEQVRRYLLGLEVRRLVIDQDGLPAGGELGRRIVAEAARRGSKNYRVILDLLERGAQLRQTEDPSLLLLEHANLSSALSAAAPGTGEQYRATREALLRRRDAFIARMVNETLRADEIGVLFLGANHEVGPLLAPDIVLEPLVDPQAVRRYLAALLGGRTEEEIDELQRQLTVPPQQDRGA